MFLFLFTPCFKMACVFYPFFTSCKIINIFIESYIIIKIQTNAVIISRSLLHSMILKITNLFTYFQTTIKLQFVGAANNKAVCLTPLQFGHLCSAQYVGVGSLVIMLTGVACIEVLWLSLKPISGNFLYYTKVSPIEELV